MTAQEMHDFFLTILDKVGSPSLTTAEIDRILNRAQIAILEDYVYHKGNRGISRDNPPNQSDPIYGYENTSFLSEAVAPLVSFHNTITTDANGRVPYASIDALLATKFYHLSNIARKDSDGVFRSCEFRRHNDHYRLEENILKKATDRYPVHLKFNTYIQVLPNDSGKNIEFTVLRYPVGIDLNSAQSSELSDNVHDNIVWRALSYAGVAIRDIPEFYQQAQIEEQKTP